MKKFEKLFYAEPHKIEIHKIANLTPMMTEIEYEALKHSIASQGQLEPAWFYRGSLVDGRHRLKAIKELHIDKIMYKNIDSQTSIEEVKNIITKGLEMRRHQTPTQKAIFAYREYINRKKDGDKVTMGSIAEEFGTTRLMMDRVRILSTVAPNGVIEQLFNGQKIKIGKIQTESMYSIINYFKTIETEVIEKKQSVDLTDNERIYITEIVDNLKMNHNTLVLKGLANELYRVCN